MYEPTNGIVDFDKIGVSTSTYLSGSKLTTSHNVLESKMPPNESITVTTAYRRHRAPYTTSASQA